MMDKKQLVESQKECASMLGMTLQQYKQYLKNVKVREEFLSQQAQKIKSSDYLKAQKNNLKLRREA